MVLNYIWIGFFLIAFVVALVKFLFLGDMQVFPAIIESTFSSSKTGFEIALYLTGVLALWLGIMKVGEKGGVIKILGKFIAPLFTRLMPELPKDHPAHGTIVMNLAANMLGLDNAATPMGLKAMKEMQEVNPDKETASNPQIMFLVLNTSGLTLIPVSIMVYRAQAGATNPADIFIPILLATFFSTMAGLLAVAFYQKINILNRVILAYLGGLATLIGVIIYWFSGMEQDQIATVSGQLSSIILFAVIVSFIALATYKRVNVYEAFIDGAKEGFGIAVKIIPYLIAILVAIGVFRASGAMDMLIGGIRELFVFSGLNTDFVDALPTAMMKPLSGSGARGMMVDAMNTFGADSFVGRVASILQGTTDTTFYIIAVYFGSVNIKRTRHAIGAGLIADFAGIISAILIAYLFFH